MEHCRGRRRHLHHPVSASPFVQRPSFAAIRALMFVLHWPLMLFGVAGAFTALWRPKWFRFEDERRVAGRQAMALVLLVAILLHMIGASFPRYGIPFRPLEYLLAVAMMTAQWRGMRRQTVAATTALR